METNYFFIKLISNRPTFPADITENEKMIMQEHSKYWKAIQDNGKCVVFGPVFDPKGAYGMGVVEADNEDEIRSMEVCDTAVIAGLAKYEFCNMRAIIRDK
jgi:uncharacterized protein